MKHQAHFQYYSVMRLVPNSILVALTFLTILFTSCNKEDPIVTTTSEPTTSTLSVQLDDRYSNSQTDAYGKAEAAKLAKEGIVEILKVEVGNLLIDRPYEVNAIVSAPKKDPEEIFVFTSKMAWSDNSGNLLIEDFEFFPDFEAANLKVDLLITHVYPTVSGQGENGAYYSDLLSRDPLLVSSSSLMIKVVNNSEEQ